MLRIHFFDTRQPPVASVSRFAYCGNNAGWERWANATESNEAYWQDAAWTYGKRVGQGGAFAHGVCPRTTTPVDECGTTSGQPDSTRCRTMREHSERATIDHGRARRRRVSHKGQEHMDELSMLVSASRAEARCI